MGAEVREGEGEEGRRGGKGRVGGKGRGGQHSLIAEAAHCHVCVCCS